MSFEGEGDEPSFVAVVRVIGETDKAIKCVRGGFSDPSPAFWVPKSVLHDDSEVSKNADKGKLIVKQWYADKEGL